jgi:VCBS repeat-containing protein
MSRRNYNFDFTQIQPFSTFTIFRVLLVAVLALLAFSSAAHAAQVTLAWDPSTQPEVTGYKIYWGTSSGNYTSSVDAGNVNIYTLTGLNSGTTYYFVATCHTSTGAESGYSNQVSTTTSIVNTAPVAFNGTLTVPEDSSGSGTLTATDADGNSLTFSLVDNPSKGSVSIAANGSFTYTPNPNANGADSFTFMAYDGTDYSNAATVSVTINSANDVPVASNGSLSVSGKTPASGTLVASDADGNSLTYSIVTAPTKGTLTISNAATGAFTYTANTNTTATDSFTFRVHDGTVYSNTATVAVSITAVNTAPVASNGSLSVSGKQTTTGKLVATDANGDSLTYGIVTNGTKGTATITNTSTGAYTYTASTGTTSTETAATDTLTFKANDGKADSNTATITVTISAGNTPPVANDGNLLVVQNSVASTLLSATDVDKDPLTYSIVTNSTKGTVTYLNPQTGAFIYKPAKDATGVDTFTFKANDGKADSNVATVGVTIEPNPYTVYEDAEDRTIRGWTIFDSKPRGAAITNLFDEQKQSWVIQTKGYGTDNGYRLLKANRTYWKNTTQFVAQWSLKYSENFLIYINVNTTAGQRYLTYTPATSDKLGSSQYVYFGIGSGAIMGQWHTFTRDLQADLDRAQPGVTITQVNNMDIRGNVRIDDVMLLAQLPALDTDADGVPDDLETNIHSTDPATGDTSLCGIDDGYKLDYLGSRWNQDADGDGIINLLDDDMDNDGTPDADEITGGTDPLVDAP